jgi:hypothetical protein
MMKRKQRFPVVFSVMVCVLVLVASGESLAAQRGHRNPADSNVVRIYADRNYRGKSQSLREGEYRLADLRIGNDQLSSLKVSDGYQVILFQNDHFRGSQKIITGDMSWIKGGFDNKTSSIIVKKISQPRREAAWHPNPKPQPNPAPAAKPRQEHQRKPAPKPEQRPGQNIGRDHSVH